MDLKNNDIFVSFERTDIIHISNVIFYYNRFSVNDIALKANGRLRIQLLRNGNWETKYTIAKNTAYSTNSTDCTLLNLNFTGLDLKNYEIKLLYDQIDSAHADMGFL